MADIKHLPGCHPIEKFGNGGFRFHGLSHRGSILVTPTGMRALRPASTADLNKAALHQVEAEKDNIDFLLFGTGSTMQRLPQPLCAWLSSLNLRAEVMSTSAAVATYNVLIAENRRLAAILLAVS